MKRCLSIVLATCLFALGCTRPTEPQPGALLGTVRYPDGRAVLMAHVWITYNYKGAVWTDSAGHYRIPLNGVSGQTTVRADDSFTPTMTSRAFINYGFEKVSVGPYLIVQDIVLKYHGP